jgi:hypothetical protein
MKKIILFLAFLFILPITAYAYIDPGSGGYLITSILAMVGGVFAVASAFVIHFFRHTVFKFFKYLWNQHRLLTVIVLAGALGAGGFYGGRELYRAIVAPRFDASLSGVHLYDDPKVYDGYNLFEGKLMDMEGNIVKQWRNISLGVLDTNGDYYAQKSFEAPLWGRYTWDDKVIWEKDFPIHHEILLTPQNTIMTFTKDVRQYQGRSVEFDVIVEFDKDGHELKRFSFWDRLKYFQQFHRKLELDMPPTFLIPEDHRKDKSIWGGNYDYYHFNSLSLTPKNRREGTHPAFQPGNWLVSCRHGSMIFILGKEKQEVLWRAIFDQIPDKLEGPHTPTMLESGNILVFDNGRYRKWSRIVEIDPVTMTIVGEYRDKDFYTMSQGSVQPLPNGNMLVTEAEEGRAFELTRNKEIVWEYYHPEKQNETNSQDKKKWGQRQEIYRMIRYPKAMINPFLEKKS